MSVSAVPDCAVSEAPELEQPLGPVAVRSLRSFVPQFANLGYSLADQILAVGGMFVVNIALARIRSKEEYGVFALSYSLFSFLGGAHNAANP